jgi:hypothetical protein
VRTLEFGAGKDVVEGGLNGGRTCFNNFRVDEAGLYSSLLSHNCRLPLFV